MNSYAKKSGILKEKDPAPTGEDLREGLIAIVSVILLVILVVILQVLR